MSLPFFTLLALAMIAGGQAKTLVLASPADPYYPLAQEIAASEGLPLASSIEETFAQLPDYILWVAAPSSLSDPVMVQMGLALKENPAAVGLISGASMESARSLWQRGKEPRGGPIYAVNGEYPSARVFNARITQVDREAAQPLTTHTLRQALQEASYLTFTGHGGSRYWQLDEETQFTSSDIPQLSSTVVGTASCQTFRPWREDSVALAFAEQGATAYAGFAFSPNEGYLLGEFDGLPFRYTWPDFPIGWVMQVQNRGALQGFAHFPFHFLLGDPRLALQSSPPYQLLEDRQDGEERILTYAGAPAGVIPVRIPGGATYDYVEIPGIASESQGSPFYNARLQMVNAGQDKLLLFVHYGGDFTLRLARRPSLYQRLAAPLADALDHSMIYLQTTGSAVIDLAAGLLITALLAWRLRRKRLSSLALRPAALVGMAFAGLHSLYAFLRLGDVIITSKPFVFPAWAPAGTGLLAGCGLFLFLNARSWRGKLAALLISSFPGLAPAAFSFGLIFAFNTFLARPQLGTNLYNLNIAALSLLSAAFLAVLSWLFFVMIQRLWPGSSSASTPFPDSEG